MTTPKHTTHEELDRLLDPGARDPAGFDRFARRLAVKFNSQNVDLEISDPMSWRRDSANAPAARLVFHKQFRADVDAILLLDRMDEARLARRIEFARIRLEEARKAEGISESDLVEGTAPGSAFAVNCASVGSALPSRVCRRWQELHALRTEMVERNLYLVLINVERYSHTTASQTDLVQEGAASLYRAVDGFDWRRGLLFRTYAVHWLNQAFRSYLYNFSHTVRVPVYLQKAMKHINGAKARLGDADATPEAIAEMTELSENVVRTALGAARSNYSLDLDLEDAGEGGRLRDVLTPDENPDPYSSRLEDVSLEDSLEGALGRLSDREKFIVRMRFGVGVEREHTLAEVASELGVSLERVRQIQVRAIGKMRTPGLRRVTEPFLN